MHYRGEAVWITTRQTKGEVVWIVDTVADHDPNTLRVTSRRSLPVAPLTRRAPDEETNDATARGQGKSGPEHGRAAPQTPATPRAARDRQNPAVYVILFFLCNTTTKKGVAAQAATTKKGVAAQGVDAKAATTKKSPLPVASW